MFTDPDDIPCPWCGRTNDLHRAVGEPDAVPENMDVSLCTTCGQFALFCVHPDGQMHLRKPPGGIGYAHIVSVLQEAT